MRTFRKQHRMKLGTGKMREQRRFILTLIHQMRVARWENNKELRSEFDRLQNEEMRRFYGLNAVGGRYLGG